MGKHEHNKNKRINIEKLNNHNNTQSLKRGEENTETPKQKQIITTQRHIHGNQQINKNKQKYETNLNNT